MLNVLNVSVGNKIRDLICGIVWILGILVIDDVIIMMSSFIRFIMRQIHSIKYSRRKGYIQIEEYIIYREQR